MHFLYINKRYRRSELCACLRVGWETGPGASKPSSIAALTSHQARMCTSCSSFIPWEKEHGGLISRDLHALTLLQGHALPWWSSDTFASKAADHRESGFALQFAAELQGIAQPRQPSSSWKRAHCSIVKHAKKHELGGAKQLRDRAHAMG